MRRLTLILCTLLVAALASAQNCFPTSGDLPFKAGEKIRMGLYFKWGAVNTEVATGRQRAVFQRLLRYARAF